MVLGKPSWRFFKCGLRRAGARYCPRGFNQGAPGRSVAHFSDAALLAVGARGVFAGDQSEITHQLAGMREAVEVAQFGHQRGGVEQRQAHANSSMPAPPVPNANPARRVRSPDHTVPTVRWA